jgi:phosphoenolpyruvate-protein kinase (PTS system EI component)
MKKRFKVLHVQDEYNRFKTVDHEKRINLHMDIHSRLLQDRELLKKSLEKIKDTAEVKEQAEQIREEIREKIKEARKNLLNERTERVNSISEQFAQNSLLIREHRDKDIEENRERSLTVKFQEEKKRESVSRHI